MEQNMDFLTFKSFISIEVLILFYYLGAVILPILIWRLLTRFWDKGKELISKFLNRKELPKFIVFFVIIFVFMELFWRMLFEFLIAYMQIRDALLLA